jgi:hypothetical protein
MGDRKSNPPPLVGPVFWHELRVVLLTVATLLGFYGLMVSSFGFRLSGFSNQMLLRPESMKEMR